MTETYRPKPGDRVHLTIEAVVDGDGDCVIKNKRLLSAYVDRESPAIVSVVPAPVALPTAFGSRIRATVTDGAHRIEGVELLLATEATYQSPWCVDPSCPGLGGVWLSPAHLSDVVVLHDAGQERQS